MKAYFTRFSNTLLALIGSVFLSAQMTQGATYVWDNSNVTGTPTATLDWFTGGPNTLGLWTGATVPVSASDTTIQFFLNNTTSLPNTAVPSTQTVNLNNGGSAFELGTLTLNGFGSATSGASLTMTLQGDALNFSGATGTISFNSVKNVAPATDPVINYTINNNIQLGTASSASALTLTGNGDNSGTTTYNIVGAISELQAGGGSILKSGTSTVTVSGAINITGAVTVSAGILNLTNSTNTASSMTVNGGTLILTGNLNPASGSMTVNTGGILRIGNNTATQFGPSGVYSGNISTGTGGTLQLWSSSSQELSGIISGSGGINKAYGGTLTLSGLNTYTGQSVFKPQTTAGFTVNVSSFDYVTSGTWANHGLGSSLGAPTTVANGTIDLNGQAQAGVTLNYVSTATGETTDRVINMGWNSSSSITLTAANTTGVLRFTSAFTSSATSAHSGSLTLRGAGQGQIDLGLPQLGTGGLVKNDAGTWTLGGSGSFTGATTITDGTLSLTSATALQNSPFSTASVAGGAADGLKVATTTLTLGGLTGANALRGRFTTALGGPSSATAQGGYDGLTNLTLNTAAGSNLAYTGAIVEGATGMSLTKTGAGIQTLNATHTYTGTTSVNGGFLQLNGNTLTGGLSVSNATFASNSTFAGVSTVGSGGVISPGASFGAIGTVTFSNAAANALTLDGSTGIFDLPSTVTTPDQIAVTGGLVVNGTNTVLLRTSTTGVLEGVYTLMTAGSTSGAGSFVLANGSATRGNATISTSGNDVILTVAAGGLAGTNNYTNATSGGSGTDNWNVAGNWGGGVPTGTVGASITDKTSAFVVVATSSTIPTYSGDLWIGNNVVLQKSFTTQHNASIDNVLGTPGQTIIYMGNNSIINDRNSYGGSPAKIIPQIVLLGNATYRNKESTNGAVNPNFNYAISGNFTFTLDGSGTNTLNAANSFSGLNMINGSLTTAAVSGSVGTATVTMSGASVLTLNHATAISDSANAIRIDNGTLTYGASAAASLTLNTRPIELNGTGNATINNSNTASSSANILTLGGGISSTAAGVKTLTLGGTNVGNNTISGNITNPSGTIALTKADAGKWVLSGTNSYSGATTISTGTLQIGAGGTTGRLTATTSIANAGNLTINRSDAFSQLTDLGAGVAITGAGSFTQAGAGTTTLTATNSYTGATNVSAGTLTLSGGNSAATNGIMTVGSNGNTGVILNITAGTYTYNTNKMFVGNSTTSGQTGTVNQSGGTVSFGTGDALLIGNGSSTGTYNLSNGNFNYVGATSTTRGVMIGVNTGASGTFNLSGTGILNLDTNDAALMVGRSDDNTVTGTTVEYNQTGGTATVQTLTIGGRTGGSAGVNATFSVTGGTFTANAFGIGADGTTAGLSRGNTNTSIITIGGTAVVTLPNLPTLRGTSSTATLNFDGGTLRNSATGTFITGLTNAFIQDGGAQFDTTLNSTTISQNLLTHGTSLGGGLTKIGINTLTLTGANTYTGGTTLNQGTLTIGTGGNLGATTGALSVNNTNSTAAGTNAILNLATAVDTTVGSLNGTIATPTSGTNTATINNGGVGRNFTVNQTSAGTFAGVIAGAGSFTLGSLSTNTLTLSGTNTYTGATLVSAGTLFISGSLVSDVTVSDGATLAGGGTVDDLILGGGSLFDIFLAVDSSDSLAATNISFAAGGFGIDNLRANGSAVDWGTVSDGIYTLITGTLNSTNLENFGSGNAYDLGGGRSAYFQNGSLQLVVETIPEPKTALLGVLGVLLLLRRRRN